MRRMKLKRKARFSRAVLLLALIVLIPLFVNKFLPKIVDDSTDESSGSSIIHNNASASDEPKTDPLLLVNKDNKLPDDYKPNLTTEGAKFDKIMLNDFEEMRSAARNVNIYLMIASAYRTAAEQEQEFKAAASGYAARPGYSEHQTGLAIDFSYGGLTEEQRNKMWDWLAKNAHKYGFILRYPEGKEHITGYNYEPWHYRYVGKQHAKAIYEKGLVLEEYLSSL